MRGRLLIDARELPDGGTFEYDVCVVGAGPVGIAVARRLEGSGLRVGLLESGGLVETRRDRALLAGAVVGRPYWSLTAIRMRRFGGGTAQWGGMCRPLEDSDFERRRWVPRSGWPITADVLRAYYRDAADVLQLDHDRFVPEGWGEGLTPSPLADGEFEPVVYQYSSLRRGFGDAFLPELERSSRVTVVLHANVVDLRLDPGTDRVGSVDVRTLTGRRHTVHARSVVLACGGIENARLLLSARTDRPAGLGNEFDNVGRHFMEHPHVGVGHLLTTGAANRGFFDHHVDGAVHAGGALRPTAALQEAHGLLSCSVVVHPGWYAIGHPQLAVPRALSGLPERLYRARRIGFDRSAFPSRAAARAGRLMLDSPEIVRTGWAARGVSRAEGSGAERVQSLYFRAEQAPNPASRVTLGDRVDAVGMREPRLDWRLADSDLASITGWLDVLDDSVRRRGLGRILRPPDDGWVDRVQGGPHHMGTTRMSAGPRDGVVDADCRVHSVRNLFVAGSSVFTTGGYANPTYTALALALRLADHLRRELT